MCGISGIFGNIQTNQKTFKRSNDLLNHRGPDGSGFFFSPNCILGHKRLAIIDLKGGIQPMFSTDKRYVIVFNGEIYNFLELKKSVCPDYPYKTNSDTEVILALYIKYKEACVNYMKGMYAFAVFDTVDDTVFIARDHVGMKPIYYALENDRIIFASEIKTILALIGNTQKIDQEALCAYLHLRYIPAPDTIYRGICKLAPAHWMKLRFCNNQVSSEIKRYWDIPEIDQNVIFDPMHLRNLIVESVRDHLISDVPVGAYLSGGLDSSTLVWAMKQTGIKPKTFTVFFKKDTKNQDVHYASKIAKLFKTDHHEIEIDDNAYQSDAPKVATNFDEPFADPAFLSNFYVAKTTRQHVTVALSADGADELFFGYQAYYKIYIYYKYNMLARYLFHNSHKPFSFYFGYDDKLLSRLCKKEAVFNPPDIDTTDILSSLQNWELSSNMGEYYLRKVDATSMLSSLETRCPFLYPPLISYARQFKPALHFKKGIGKHLLRSTMQDILPDEILNRPKQGFSHPIHKLLTDENLYFIRETLQNLPIIDNDQIKLIINRYREYKSGTDLVWRLLTLSWWFKHHQSHLSL